MISPTLKESGRKKKKEYQGDKERHPPRKSQSGAAKNADQEGKGTKKSRRGKMTEKQCLVDRAGGDEKCLNEVEGALKEGKREMRSGEDTETRKENKHQSNDCSQSSV